MLLERMQSGGPTQYFPILCIKFVFACNCIIFVTRIQVQAVTC